MHISPYSVKSTSRHKWGKLSSTQSRTRPPTPSGSPSLHSLSLNPPPAILLSSSWMDSKPVYDATEQVVIYGKVFEIDYSSMQSVERFIEGVK